MKKIYLIVNESGGFDEDPYEGYCCDEEVIDIAFEHVADAKAWIEANASWERFFEKDFEENKNDDEYIGYIKELMKRADPLKWHDEGSWFGGYTYEYEDDCDEEVIVSLIKYSIRECDLY